MHTVNPPIEIGQVFGHFTVLERAENKFRQKRWLCRCTCGNERVVWQTSLYTGASQSCGCINKVGDITGQRFGRLTVVRYVDTVGHHKRWLCKCDCGKTTISWQLGLRKGSSKSCGCLKSDNTTKRWSDYREPTFWSRVNKNAANGCWEWIGTVEEGEFASPYPQTNYDGKKYRVHRLAYTLLKGPIPDGKMLLHSCDNPKCCNPDHLRPGTHQENMQDVVDRCRRLGMLAGEDNGRAKLTQEIADIIRERYSSGETQQQIADSYGISQHAVSKIVRNLRYVTNSSPQLVQTPGPEPTLEVTQKVQRQARKKDDSQLDLF